MINEIILWKILISIIVVIGMSIVAERLGPKNAGILSGYPTGTAIILFFLGIEYGTEFASVAALSNMIGIIGALGFIYFYYKSSKFFKKNSIFISSIIAIIGYLIVAFVLGSIKISLFVSILFPLLAIGLFYDLFRSIDYNDIKKKVKFTTKTFLFRGIVAAGIIVLITGAGSYLGPELTGLFSAFPTTLFPLILIIHKTYDEKKVHSIIKNVPTGNIALLLFSLVVSLGFPIFGVYLGILIALIAATTYLIALKIIEKKLEVSI